MTARIAPEMGQLALVGGFLGYLGSYQLRRSAGLPGIAAYAFCVCLEREPRATEIGQTALAADSDECRRGSV